MPAVISDQSNNRARIAWLLPAIIVGFAFVLCAAIALIVLARWERDVSTSIRATRDSQEQLSDLQIIFEKAETSQRGFLLTGRSSYLEPYKNAREALAPALNKLEHGLADDANAIALVAKLKVLADSKFAELQQTIDLRDANDATSALAIVNGDAGKQWMDATQATITELRERLQRTLTSRRGLSENLIWARESLLLIIAISLLIFGSFVLWETRNQFRDVADAREKLRSEARLRFEAETQVRQLQKMEAVGQLTGGIAHDFNNMLGVVMGSLESAKLKLPVDGHALAKLIDLALAATDRAATLTARLLAFARQQPLSPTVIDPNKLISGMTDMLRRTLGENVMPEFVLGGGVWKVFVDSAQLEMSVLNLSVNARDAMEQGGKLTIETHNASLDDRYASEHAEVKAGQYVLLSVSDTGIGMSADVVERAFEPFFTTKLTGRGTGLGLSQVFGFVKQSGGHVKIYSEVGSGTTVKIYLPRYVGDAAEKSKPHTLENALPTGSADTIILLVEDEEHLRIVARDVLGNLGYTVIDTGSPATALQIIRERDDIALLFTDIVMPAMTGRQLADEATKIRDNLAVLYTTGYTRNAIVHNGMVDAGVEYLQKPFTISQLAAKVKEVIDKRQQRWSS